MTQVKKNNTKCRIKRMILWGLMVIVIFRPLKTEAAESAICHQHVDGCYRTGSILCTDEVKVTTHAEEFNCATCGRIAAAHVVVETYSCKYITSERELRRIAYCYTCHSVVQNLEKGGQPNHYRIGQINICGFGTDTVVTKVSLNNTNTEWTKDTTVLKVSVIEPTAGLSLAPYSYTFSGGMAQGESCTVSENGLYSVTVTASNGQTTTTSIQVSNIDKTGPTIQKFYVDKEYPEYESATLTVEATDTESGLAENAYSFNGGESFGSKNSFKITSNGTYTVHVRDKVGNNSIQTLTVDCFSKRPDTTVGIVPETPVVTAPGGVVEAPAKTQNGLHNTKFNNSDKRETGTKVNENMVESDLEKEMLKERLERSGKNVPMENIPGIYSSVLKTNAEKNAVPATLNVVTNRNEVVYAQNVQTEGNLVKNISLAEENEKSDGSFAQVSKAVVGAGVLICIGMVGFLIVFLVKKQ